MTDGPALVAELDVTDLSRSLGAYMGVLGFRCAFQRPEERFAYLMRGEVHLMIEEAGGPGRRFTDAPLVRPFGRGVNLQMRVPDVEALYDATRCSDLAMVLPIEERWYRQGSTEAGQRQFVVADPDGYLLRFFTPLDRRPTG